ncbi:hypothetical protein HK097_001342, partial [Rhizophlyctis rosea]
VPLPEREDVRGEEVRTEVPGLAPVTDGAQRKSAEIYEGGEGVKTVAEGGEGDDGVPLAYLANGGVKRGSI